MTPVVRSVIALVAGAIGLGVGTGLGLIFQGDDCNPGVEATCLVTSGRVILALIIAGVGGLVGWIAAGRITARK